MITSVIGEVSAGTQHVINISGVNNTGSDIAMDGNNLFGVSVANTNLPSLGLLFDLESSYFEINGVRQDPPTRVTTVAVDPGLGTSGFEFDYTGYPFLPLIIFAGNSFLFHIECVDTGGFVPVVGDTLSYLYTDRNIPGSGVSLENTIITQADGGTRTLTQTDALLKRRISIQVQSAVPNATLGDLGDVNASASATAAPGDTLTFTGTEWKNVAWTRNPSVIYERLHFNGDQNYILNSLTNTPASGQLSIEPYGVLAETGSVQYIEKFIVPNTDLEGNNLEIAQNQSLLVNDLVCFVGEDGNGTISRGYYKITAITTVSTDTQYVVTFLSGAGDYTNGTRCSLSWFPCSLLSAAIQDLKDRHLNSFAISNIYEFSMTNTVPNTGQLVFLDAFDNNVGIMDSAGKIRVSKFDHNNKENFLLFLITIIGNKLNFIARRHSYPGADKFQVANGYGPVSGTDGGSFYEIPGSIFQVGISYGGSFSDLELVDFGFGIPGSIGQNTDTVVNNPVDNQVLTFQSGSGGWINQYPPIRYFTSTGEQNAGRRVWTGSVTSDGTTALFNADITTGGFTTIESVAATPVKDTTNDPATAPIVSIQTVSTTSITGITLESRTILNLGDDGLEISPGVLVYLTVYGS
jgi:hypothetical protein